MTSRYSSSSLLQSILVRGADLKTAQIIATATVSGLAALYSLYYYHTTYSVQKKRHNGFKEVKIIPSPKGALPFFGHIFQIDKDLPAVKFHEWFYKYGPLVRINIGSKEWILIGDSYIANELLKTKGALTSGRPYHPFTTDYYALNRRGMTFTDADKRWKRSRAAAQSLLSSKAVDRLTKTLEIEATQATQRLLEETAKNGQVNIVKHMQLAALNVILRICFGVYGESVDDFFIQSIVETIDITIKWGAPSEDLLGTVLPGGISSVFSYFTGREQRYREFTYEKRDPLFRQLISKALESDTDCFAKDLYRIKGELELEDDDILVLLLDLINAGTDPTAITLTWAFVILCHHKDVQKKIQKEIDMFIAAHDGRLPNFEERECLPYLLSVQKECMRYRPSNHIGLPHKAIKDFKFNGYSIRKGSVLLACTYSLNLSPDRYQNPEKFLPDRYAGDPRPLSVSVNSSIDTRDQFMFGWGRRICPGVNLADAETFNFWVRIFATSTIEPPLNKQGVPMYPNLDACYDGGLVVTPIDANLRFVKRRDRLV
ncbi:cytochrome P450 [Zychaea mexicana]|uniref:cytochrome P450 n=1 Tax=Zychaea mexicana TaxID=64656 RepID=UPI0022FE7CF3|nr:cytochrome P450 [Zychaea mexicana]KAI9491887.1 cytochrome P450 [Zychaea mexicana]